MEDRQALLVFVPLGGPHTLALVILGVQLLMHRLVEKVVVESAPRLETGDLIRMA